MEWRPTAANPDRSTYWAIGDPGRLPWNVVRAGRSAVIYRFEGERVMREHGHPDGPSSVPYFVVRRGWAYPSEGYPSGASSTAFYRVRRVMPRGSLRVGGVGDGWD